MINYLINLKFEMCIPVSRRHVGFVDTLHVTRRESLWPEGYIQEESWLASGVYWCLKLKTVTQIKIILSIQQKNCCVQLY